MCRAVESGRQIILLRKGGIAEDAGEFAPLHATFWLLPTHTHQQTQGLRDGADELLTGAPAPMGLSCLCRVASVARIERPGDLDALESHHIWKPETIRERFRYRRPGLWLMAVRAWRRHGPWRLGPTPDLAGCKSWVELPEPLSTAETLPVLSDPEFERRLAAVVASVGGGPEVRET